MAKKTTIQSLLFEQQLLALLIFTILVICVWIVASIYFSYTTSKITQEEAIIVVPLSPKIDDELFVKLEQRKWWTDQDINTFTPSIEISTDAGIN